MAHPNPEELVLLALGDQTGADHLESCEFCRADVLALRAVVEVGAETDEVRHLAAPPESVWAAIAERVQPTDRPVGTAPAVDRPAQRPDRPRVSPPGGAGGAGGAGPGRGRVPRTPSRRRGWMRVVAAAVVAALVGVAGTLGVIRLLDREPARQEVSVYARADLSALPIAPPGATGTARVLGGGQDTRLHLHVTGLPLRQGYFEVWLINPEDQKDMISIGQLGDGTDVILPLTSTIDLRRYRLVDVSAEGLDNSPLHSGQSLLRGQLTT